MAAAAAKLNNFCVQLLSLHWNLLCRRRNPRYGLSRWRYQSPNRPWLLLTVHDFVISTSHLRPSLIASLYTPPSTSCVILHSPYHAPAGPQAVRMLARVVRRARQSKERSLIGGMHLSFPLSPIGLSCNYLVTGRRERGRSGSLYVTLRRSPPFKQYFFFFFFALCICCHSFPDNALSP